MKKILLRVTFIFGFTCIFYISKTNSGGPGAGYTNAPSESNCAASGCHSGGLTTSGSGYNRIALDMNMTGNGYIPDSTYELLLNHKESGLKASGFQITCLTESTGKSAGTFSTLDSRTQSMSLTVGSDTRSYLGHSSSSVSSTDSTSYRIKWKAPSTNVGKVRFYVVLNKANSDGSTSGDVIYAKTWSVSPSSLLPTAKIKILDTLYCTNIDLKFGATTNSKPTSYKWEFLDIGTNPIVKTDSTPTQSFNTVKKYRVVLTVKNNKGTSLPDTFSFTTVQGASLSFLTPSGTSEVCKGDTLKVSCTKPAGHTIQWSHGPTTQNVGITDSGVYTVTTISSNKCRRVSSPLTVKVLPIPSVLLLKSFSGDTICANEHFSLGAFKVSGTIDSVSYNSRFGPYVKDDSLAQTLSSGPKSYSIWGKDPKGCVSKPSSLTIQVKDKIAGPVLTSSNIDFTGFRVNWTSIPSATAYRVSIDSGKTFIAPSSGNSGLFHDVTNLLGNHTMKVWVYAVTPGLCSNTETSNIDITTRSCSPIAYTLTSNKSKACLGSTITVTVNNLNGMNIGILVDNKPAGKDTIQNIVIDGTRNYEIAVIDSTGLICGYTRKTVMLMEDTVGLPKITPANFSACSNSPVPLTIAVSSDPNIDSLEYYKNGVLQSSGKSFNHQFTVAHNDSVWAIAKNSSGCISPRSSATKVIVNPIPNADFSITNTLFDYTFSSIDTTGSHKWKVGGDSVLSKNAQFDLTTFKNDSVEITHVIVKNGCSSTSSRKVFVPDFAGVKVKSIPGANLFPNPATEVLNVFVPVIKNNAHIEIYNATGQLVLAAPIKQGNNPIAIEMLSPGQYQFKLSADKKESSGSIIISR